MDSVGEGAVPARKLLVRLPVARGRLIAVVDPDVAQETAVEMRGAELPVGDHLRLGDRALQPARPAPPRGGGPPGEPPPGERGGGGENRAGRRPAPPVPRGPRPPAGRRA